MLAEKISRLIIWYSLQKRDLSDIDKNHLDESLVKCYARYGITSDNSTLVDEQGNFREMPILADWYDTLNENPETKHLAVVLARYVTGSAAAMGQRNDIDLNNKYIVLDTSGMPDDLQLPGIFWATDVANDLIMNAGTELSALIADELWSLVGANSNPLAAGFVQEMVKTIRGLGGIAVTSTQGMQDLFGLDGGKYGKGILDSSRIKLVMQMEEQEARLIQGVLNLSEEEVHKITRFRAARGCCASVTIMSPSHSTRRSGSITPSRRPPPICGCRETEVANEQQRKKATSGSQAISTNVTRGASTSSLTGRTAHQGSSLRRSCGRVWSLAHRRK